jgi:hypothetical protein
LLLATSTINATQKLKNIPKQKSKEIYKEKGGRSSQTILEDILWDRSAV